MNKASVNKAKFCSHKHQYQLVLYPEENLLGHRVYASLALVDVVNQFSEVVLSYDPNSNNEKFQLLHIYILAATDCFFRSRCCDGVWVARCLLGISTYEEKGRSRIGQK